MNTEKQSPQEPLSSEAASQDPPQQPPSEELPPAGWGAAPPPPPANRPRWSVRRTVLAVAVAVGIAAAGGVAIYAASGSAAGDQSGPGGMGPGGGRVVGGPMADLAHGEFQTGEVTAISDDSITAKSDDGYTRTYVIDSDTVLADGIENGDDVMIVATTSDDQATAATVSDQGQGMVPPRRDGQDGQGNGQDTGPDGGQGGN